MFRIAVDSHYCKGCALCVHYCPKDILQLDANTISSKGYHPVICMDEEECIGCKNCQTMCPDAAIQVVR